MNPMVLESLFLNKFYELLLSCIILGINNFNTYLFCSRAQRAEVSFDLMHPKMSADISSERASILVATLYNNLKTREEILFN